MERYKQLYYSACSVLPSGLLQHVTTDSLLLPYHHLVSDESVSHVRHLYRYKNTRQFNNDLDELLRYYRPVSVEEVVAAVKRGGPLPRNSFLLSFDDGFREVYDIVAPMLYAKGVSAVFFINPAFLDNRLLFYRCKISLVIEQVLQKSDHDYLLKDCAAAVGADPSAGKDDIIRLIKKLNHLNQDVLKQLGNMLGIDDEAYLRQHRPFLSTDQVQELSGKGFSIGAHSWDHPYYNLLSPAEQERQTLDSCHFVKSQFKQSYQLFSFPHSDRELPQDFFTRVAGAGSPIDLFFGTQNQLREMANRVLHRFNAERPEIAMRPQLKGLLALMACRRLLRNENVQRKW